MSAIMSQCKRRWGTHLVMTFPLAVNIDQMYKSKDFFCQLRGRRFRAGLFAAGGGKDTSFIFHFNTRLWLNTSFNRMFNLLDMETNWLMFPDLTCSIWKL